MKAHIEYKGGRSFKAKVRTHDVVVDLPKEMGGSDSAPSPTELLAISLGSCAGVFATRYLETAGLNSEGLSIDLNWEFDEKKSRICKIHISITIPNAVLGKRKKALLKVVENCVIHRTLTKCPEMDVVLNG